MAENFYFDLFKEDFPYEKDAAGDTTVDIGNYVINIKNNDSFLKIDCTKKDAVKIDGILKINMNNVVFVDFEENLFNTGLLPKAMKAMQYFNLSCTIEIMSDKYIICIGSEEDVKGRLLNPTTPIEKYFKNTDIYMTDINIKRANINNKAKFNWLVKSLYYMQATTRDSKYQYDIEMHDFDITQQMVKIAKVESNYEKIYIVPVMKLTNINFDTKETENEFKEIFDSKYI